MNEVVVVEGKNDTQALRRALQVDTIETNGSAIPEHVLAEIERANSKRGVIVFTDPDAAGERIRRIISQRIPGVKHAFLSRSLAIKEQKVGIEFATPEAIREALDQVRKPVSDVEVARHPLSRAEYIELGFTGRPDSARLRALVAEQLGIGYGNAKQFYRRLALLQISRTELYQAIETVKRGQSG